MPEALVSRLFTSYMLQNEVPHWAQHYARRVIERHARGQLDENDVAVAAKMKTHRDNLRPAMK